MFLQIRNFSIILLSVLLLFGCNDGSEATQDTAAVQEEALLSTTAGSPVPTDRKIARTVNMRFQVKSLEKSTENLESLIKKYDASIVQAQEYSSDGSLEANYTIRVLPEKLDGLLKELQKESIFLDSKNISAEDVTMQYVDVTARLKAKQAVEQRYLQLLEKADKVQDILAIEAELNKVREELEVAQAQLKELNKQVNYSTITLTMYQLVPASYQDRTSYTSQALSALDGGWQLLKSLTIGFVYLWPIWILLPLGIWVYRKLKRRRQINL